MMPLSFDLGAAPSGDMEFETARVDADYSWQQAGSFVRLWGRNCSWLSLPLWLAAALQEILRGLNSGSSPPSPESWRDS